MGFLPFNKEYHKFQHSADTNALGRVYKDGETIVNQGDTGDCMFVIQSGKAEVVQIKNGKEVHIANLSEGDFFGEMALFEHTTRSATVKVRGDTRVLTVDKRTLLQRVQEDPSMAFRVLQKMSHRIRELNLQTSRIQAVDRRNWQTRPDKFKPDR